MDIIIYSLALFGGLSLGLAIGIETASFFYNEEIEGNKNWDETYDRFTRNIKDSQNP